MDLRALHILVTLLDCTLDTRRPITTVENSVEDTQGKNKDPCFYCRISRKRCITSESMRGHCDHCKEKGYPIQECLIRVDCDVLLRTYLLVEELRIALPDTQQLMNQLCPTDHPELVSQRTLQPPIMAPQQLYNDPPARTELPRSVRFGVPYPMAVPTMPMMPSDSRNIAANRGTQQGHIGLQYQYPRNAIGGATHPCNYPYANRAPQPRPHGIATPGHGVVNVPGPPHTFPSSSTSVHVDDRFAQSPQAYNAWPGPYSAGPYS